MQKTNEISGAAMLKRMHQYGGVLHCWNGGFWCTSHQPLTFQFGDSPDEPWVGSVMLQQMLSSGKIIQDGAMVHIQNECSFTSPKAV